MVRPSYLIEMNDGRHIVIEWNPADVPLPAQAPPPQKRKEFIGTSSGPEPIPDDIDTLICTHFDADHAAYRDSFQKVEFVVQRHHYQWPREETRVTRPTATMRRALFLLLFRPSLNADASRRCTGRIKIPTKRRAASQLGAKDRSQRDPLKRPPSRLVFGLRFRAHLLNAS